MSIRIITAEELNPKEREEQFRDIFKKTDDGDVIRVKYKGRDIYHYYLMGRVLRYTSQREDMADLNSCVLLVNLSDGALLVTTTATKQNAFTSLFGTGDELTIRELNVASDVVITPTF